jgi:uridylate kinase
MSSKKVVVISLGGSLIVQDKINSKTLKNFKKVLLKNTKKYKFVVVCGGGKTARKYINGLEDLEKNKEYFQTLIGIAITRLNARFMTYFFKKEAYFGIPEDMIQIKELLRTNDIIFCGALRYAKHETSDGTSAKLARFFKTDFINLTNVLGLYDKNPKIYKNAKFIPEISHKEFCKMASKIHFKPGQHFVLDEPAAYTINKYKIQTFIIGPDMNQLDNLLNKKHFIGTVIF